MRIALSLTGNVLRIQHLLFEHRTAENDNDRSNIVARDLPNGRSSRWELEDFKPEGHTKKVSIFHAATLESVTCPAVDFRYHRKWELRLFTLGSSKVWCNQIVVMDRDSHEPSIEKAKKLYWTIVALMKENGIEITEFKETLWDSADKTTEVLGQKVFID